MFLNYVNNQTGSATDNLHYNATVTYYNISNQKTGGLQLASSNRILTRGEHPVRVTEWVLVNKQFPGDDIVRAPGSSRGGALMARLNDDAQWIILMGFIVSFSLFFLAIILNQSIVVGQTTAESVLDFPKNDIFNLRSEIINSVYYEPVNNQNIVNNDIVSIELARKGATVSYSDYVQGDYTYINIHYNNGVTAYNETWVSP